MIRRRRWDTASRARAPTPIDPDPEANGETLTNIVNRAAFVVRPREPYLKWAASLDEDAPGAAEGLIDRASVYLVAEDPRGQTETPPIEDYFEVIFEAELGGWSLDEGLWPQSRELDRFHEWFDVTSQSVVVDLEANALEVEEM